MGIDYSCIHFILRSHSARLTSYRSWLVSRVFPRTVLIETHRTDSKEESAQSQALPERSIVTIVRISTAAHHRMCLRQLCA